MLDAISSLRADCWSTFPKKSLLFKAISFHAALCICNYMQTLPYAHFSTWFECYNSASWHLWPILQLNCAWHGSHLSHSLPQDQGVHMHNSRDPQISSSWGWWGSSVLLSPGSPSHPAADGPVMLTVIFTSFSAAGKFLTLGQFGYSRILFVCTRAKPKPEA